MYMTIPQSRAAPMLKNVSKESTTTETRFEAGWVGKDLSIETEAGLSGKLFVRVVFSSVRSRNRKRRVCGC